MGWDLICCAGAPGGPTEAEEQPAGVSSGQATDPPEDPVDLEQPQVTLALSCSCVWQQTAPIRWVCRSADLCCADWRCPAVAWLTCCLCVGLQEPPALNSPGLDPTLLTPGQTGVDRDATNPPAQSTAAQETQVGAPPSLRRMLRLLSPLSSLSSLRSLAFFRTLATSKLDTNHLLWSLDQSTGRAVSLPGLCCTAQCMTHRTGLDRAALVPLQSGCLRLSPV